MAVDPNAKSGPTAATGTTVGNFDGIEATDRPLRVVPWLRRDAGDGASSRTNSPRPTLSSSIAVAVGTAMAIVMLRWAASRRLGLLGSGRGSWPQGALCRGVRDEAASRCAWECNGPCAAQLVFVAEV